MTDLSLSLGHMGPAETSPESGGRTSPIAISWQRPEGLYGFSALAWILKIVTFGIYSFWARAETRRRIWQAIRFDGEPLRYTGTGGELFKGFLIATIGILLPLVAIYTVLIVSVPRQSPLLPIIGAAFYAIFFFLAGIATYRASRYRLSRTLWRGIRAGLDGSPMAYAISWFWTGLLVPFTLGWILPWRAVRLNRAMTTNMRFGSTHFTFDAPAGPLYARFAAIWVASAAIIVVVSSIAWTALMSDAANTFREAGAPYRMSPETSAKVGTAVMIAYLLFGILAAWYQASKLRHFAAHTAFAGATFKSSVTTAGLIWLMLSNMAIVVLTLGILIPVTQARSARYYVEHLSLDGVVDAASVMQGAEHRTTAGEGLAQAFDLDAF